MRIIQILLGVFLLLYAINIYLNRPSVPRHVVVDGTTEIGNKPDAPIWVISHE